MSESMDVLTVTKVDEEFRVKMVLELGYHAIIAAIQCCAAQQGLSDEELLAHLREDIPTWQVWGIRRGESHDE